MRLNDGFICTEHILLGLLRDPNCRAVRVLGNLGLDTDKIVAEVEKLHLPGTFKNAESIPSLSKLAKKALGFAVEESKSLGVHYVGTEHMLLGLMREEKGIAAQALKNQGIAIDDAWKEASLFGENIER